MENLEISKEVLELAERVEKELVSEFKKCDEICFSYSNRVLNAFINNGVSMNDLSGTNGYGYNDVGRDKIDRIYINFCNPWPKSKHNKRRLTHTRQLENYKTFLNENGEIYFKTDDDELFEDSIYYFKDSKLEKLQHSQKSRGEVCMEIEEELLKIYQDSELHVKPAQLSKRGGARYSEVAISLVDSIWNDRQDVHDLSE